MLCSKPPSLHECYFDIYVLLQSFRFLSHASSSVPFIFASKFLFFLSYPFLPSHVMSYPEHFYLSPTLLPLFSCRHPAQSQQES
jgi:hypothetical protein